MRTRLGFLDFPQYRPIIYQAGYNPILIMFLSLHKVVGILGDDQAGDSMVKQIFPLYLHN